MNKLPQDIIHKIQLYLSHPCADELKAHIEYVEDRGKVTWQWSILTGYKSRHAKNRLTAKYNKVMQELANLNNFRLVQKRFWVGHFDYKMLLRATRIMEDSDSDDEHVESLDPTLAQVANENDCDSERDRFYAEYLTPDYK